MKNSDFNKRTVNVRVGASALRVYHPRHQHTRRRHTVSHTARRMCARPAAEMASPSPTVRRGRRQTSTGARAYSCPSHATTTARALFKYYYYPKHRIGHATHHATPTHHVPARPHERLVARSKPVRLRQFPAMSAVQRAARLSARSGTCSRNTRGMGRVTVASCREATAGIIRATHRPQTATTSRLPRPYRHRAVARGARCNQRRCRDCCRGARPRPCGSRTARGTHRGARQ